MRVLRLGLSAVALAFVVYALFDLYRKWEGAPVEVSVPELLVALVLASAAMAMQFLAWHALIFAWDGTKMPWKKAALVYIDSQLARYAPGKVGLPAVRIAGAASVGVTPAVMVKSLLVELLSWCAVGVSVGLSFLAALSLVVGADSPWSSGAGLPMPLTLGVLAALCVASLGGLVLVDRSRFPAGLIRFLQAEGKGPLVPWSLPLYHLAHYLCWIASGVAIGLALGQGALAGAIGGAALCLALVAGFLALLAPAGAGVREVILTYALAPFFGPALSLSFSVLARAASLLSDVLLWLILHGLCRKRD